MQTIYLDISNKGVVPTIYAKQGDVGRKFLVVLTDAGVPYAVPAGSVFSVWYDGDSGEGNYTDIGEQSAFSINGNAVTVEMIEQMLSVDGNGILCLALNKVDGGQIGSWNIPYVCERIPGFESEEATSYYTAFSETVRNLQAMVETDPTVPSWAKASEKPTYTATEVGARPDTWMPTASDVGAAPAIESTDFPGCYYRTVNGKTEWINPPFELGVEYLTTERWNGKAVFAKLLDLGSLPANDTATYDGSLTTATKVHFMELLAYNSGYQYIPLAYESGITSAYFNRGSARFVIKTNTTYNNIVNVYLKVKYTDNR